jgi:hypothetical protein
VQAGAALAAPAASAAHGRNRETHVKSWKHILAAACWAIALPAAAQAPGTLVVTGNDWMNATATERRAFLVGAANMVMAEGAYAKRRNLPPAPVGARLSEGIGKLTLNEVEARVTRFYESNPARRGEPVMGVLWQEYGGGAPRGAAK